MKKTYISPSVLTEATEARRLLMVTSIRISDDEGDEEYVKEQYDDLWDEEW